jgi:acetoin utilization deacetylase AcuC-like enzyme
MESIQPHKLALIFFPAYDWCIEPTHPEREERLLYTHDVLREEGIFDLPGVEEYRTEMATSEDAARVHFFPMGLDKVAGMAHMISAGGAIAAGKLFAEKKAKKAFAMVRPPGHHAGKVVHAGRGFCNINNMAIMIEYLRTHYGYKRIAIVDTDCHHGDGSQDIYWFDPDTLYISLHQDGRTLYPGSGFKEEMGAPNAWGATINIPLPPETGDEGFLLATRNIVVPILKDWKPDLIVNSAGQDNHFSDPITNMRLTAKGYSQMVGLIDADIAVLEGGYSIMDALPFTNMAIILTMAGLDGSKVAEPPPRAGNYLGTSQLTLEKIEKLGDYIHAARKCKPTSSQLDMRLIDGYYVRTRNLFYDNHPLDSSKPSNWTSHVHESRMDYLRDCSNCPGVHIIRTASNLMSEKIFVELPREPCPECELIAAKALENKFDF